MWLKIISFGQLFVVLLLVQYNVRPSSAANMAQLKNQQQQQQTLGQAASAAQQQHQQQQHLVHSQTQHQLQQPVQPAIAAHPSNSGIHGSNGGHHNAASQNIPSSSSSASASAALAHLPQAQYVNDKEATMQEVLKHFNTDDDLNDPYQILSELNRDKHATNLNHPIPPPASAPSSPPSSSSNYPWNLYDRPYATPAPLHNLPPPPMAGLFSQMFNPFDAYASPFSMTPRFMPIMSYPQPVYVPYPFIMTPEMFYPGFSAMPNAVNDYEDAMSRGASSTRRPSPSQHSPPSSYQRNSPIYYVRLPPTPYMFLPSLGLQNPASPMSAFPAMLPYQSLPTFPSFSSVFNVPINFLANGKPNNIYQMSAPPNDIQNPLQFANIPSSFNTRPPPPPPPHTYRPSASSHNYFNAQPPTMSSSASSPQLGYGSYGGSTSSLSSSSSSMPSHQDSKLTALKRPYYFNGRPEDIYILPNNFNSLYSSESSYY